ncbi:MAG: carboxypeptidase-like regulatory domain-containing protein [Terriglobales bacterium]
MKKLLLVLLGCVLVATVVRAEQKTASLNFVVLKDYNGKPVRNASVVLHSVDKDGKQSKGGVELKTDPDGKVSYSGVPLGKLRVQVLAPGYQTFGEDVMIDQPQQEITVKLKRPVKQYSIYENKPAENEKKPEEKPKP